MKTAKNLHENWYKRNRKNININSIFFKLPFCFTIHIIPPCIWHFDIFFCLTSQIDGTAISRIHATHEPYTLVYARNLPAFPFLAVGTAKWQFCLPNGKHERYRPPDLSHILNRWHHLYFFRIHIFRFRNSKISAYFRSLFNLKCQIIEKERTNARKIRAHYQIGRSKWNCLVVGWSFSRRSCLHWIRKCHCKFVWGFKIEWVDVNLNLHVF